MMDDMKTINEALNKQYEDLIQEPTADIENGQSVEMQQIFGGAYLKIYTAYENLIFEFIDDDDFINGFSFPHDVTESEFTSQMKDFIKYVD